MSRRSIGSFVLLATFSSVVALADPPEESWYLGGSISYVSFTDDIRNNAHIIFTDQFGDDGIPFTGDPNELLACTNNPGLFYPAQDPFCDPRPDHLLSRESKIDAGYGFDLTLGYKFTPRFGVQVDAGYRKGEVGPIDVYQAETIPLKDRLGNPTRLVDRNRSLPMAAGDLTTIPLTLSGFFSFGVGKAFRPWIGAGVGVIHTKLEANSEIDDLRQVISAERVRGFSNEFGEELTNPIFNGTFLKEDGQIPFEMPLDVRVDNGYEWHLSAGLEFFFNDRFSLVFDASYSFVSQEVEIDLGGEDQLDVLYWPGELFRPDGTLDIFTAGAVAPNPICGDPTGSVDESKFGCYNQAASARVNPEGEYRDPRNSSNILTGGNCPAVGDFNRDGQIDVCYDDDIASPTGITRATGFWVVQGGSLDMTALTIAIGMRVHY